MIYLYFLVFISIVIILFFQKSIDQKETFNNKNKIKGFFNYSKIILYFICVVFIICYNLPKNVETITTVPEIYLSDSF